MKKGTTVCNLCGGKAEFYEKKEGYTENTDRGRVKRSWITVYYQCLDCGESYSCGKEHTEEDRSFRSMANPHG